MSALLGLHGLSKAWFGVPAVSDMHLEVPAGICLGVIGENGAGKSTLMNMIGGVVPPTSGSMTWRGDPYAPKNPADAKANGIAFIHQELNLFTNLSVAETSSSMIFPTVLASSTSARWLRDRGFCWSASTFKQSLKPRSAVLHRASGNWWRSPKRSTAKPR